MRARVRVGSEGYVALRWWSRLRWWGWRCLIDGGAFGLYVTLPCPRSARRNDRTAAEADVSGTPPPGTLGSVTMSLRVEFVGVALGVEMGIWAGAALAVLLGGFQLYEWLSCRKSPARRNATARNSFVAALVATVAGRRGLLDASIVSAGGLFMLGVGAPLSLWAAP